MLRLAGAFRAVFKDPPFGSNAGVPSRVGNRKLCVGDQPDEQ